MRTQLLNIVRQSAQTSQKFADYNFRSYFVAKFNHQAKTIENDQSLTITNEMIKKAEADLAMVNRQTAIQEGFQAKIDEKSDFVRVENRLFGSKIDWKPKKQMYTLEPTIIEHNN